MSACPACLMQLPDDARFCGFCGFRLMPISPEAHRRLSESLRPLVDDGPILLTKRKGGKPRLEIVEDGSEVHELITKKHEPSAKDLGYVTTERDMEQVRHFQRFPLKVEVSYTSEHNFYTGLAQNVSSGGIFIATPTPAPIGQILEVSFTVPGLGRTCTVLCRVCWVKEYNPLEPEEVSGMGLQFSQLDADAQAAIELFIDHREPIFFDD